MIAWLLARAAIAALFAVVIGLAVMNKKRERLKTAIGEKSAIYRPYAYIGCIPAIILAIVILELLFYGPEKASSELLALCFNSFLVLGLYYIVLAPLMPWLRRRISAWVCASLWLLPNVLFLIRPNSFSVGMPLYVVVTSGDLAYTLLYIWLAGCCLILFWKIVEHLVFRRRILRGAVEAEPEAQALLLSELELAKFRGRKPLLLRSANITSPLSIGLYRRTIRIVLPERAYSEDDLRLILRHEVVHVCHEDALSKFSLVSTEAMCWFNPLVWLAMRRSAEDIELSCDESVLLDANESGRRKYADLLLKETGNAHGFTTCLSSSARSLRYRLKNIIRPQAKYDGALAISLAVFFLLMCVGQVALAYGGGTGADIVFQAHDPANFKLEDEPQADEAALSDYLASLELRELTGDYDFDVDGARHRGFIYSSPLGQVYVGLYDNALELLIYNINRHVQYYYIPEGVDWELMDRILPR